MFVVSECIRLTQLLFHTAVDTFHFRMVCISARNSLFSLACHINLVCVFIERIRNKCDVKFSPAFTLRVLLPSFFVLLSMWFTFVSVA